VRLLFYRQKGPDLTAIQLQSISKRLGERHVLQEISLEVQERQRLIILGPSGCGKTSLLRLLAGFIAPDAGRIVLDGITVAADGKNLKEPEERNVGMVFQDLALWPHMTVLGNVEFGLRSSHIPQEQINRRVQEILALVKMQDFANSFPAKLSGGEQQRIALARALVLRPKILLMDEPLSSLDSALAEQLRNEIRKIQEQVGFTLVYVTHNLEEAYDMATSVAVMKNGRIDWMGKPQEINKRGA